jgi:hypothetical protein
MTTAQVRATCNVRADRSSFDDEANPIRLLGVAVDGQLVTARLDGGRVLQIWTASPRLKTRSRLGVDTTLATLERQLPALEGGQSEGGPLYVFSNRLCGLSFQASYKPTNHEYMRLGDTWKRADILKLPAQTRVKEVLMSGCGEK